MEVDFTKALAGVAALSVGIAALTTATGAFDQMQRNNPGWCSAVFAFAALAGVLVVGAGLLTGGLEKGLLFAGLAIFLVAAVAGIALLIFSRNDRAAPSLNVALSTASGVTVTGTVKVEELTSKDILTVEVVVGKTLDDKSPADVYNARLGPDATGTAQITLNVPIEAKGNAYTTVMAWVNNHPGDCFGDASPKGAGHAPGCVFMQLPPAT